MALRADRSTARVCRLHLLVPALPGMIAIRLVTATT